jgi:hypothetical protein
LGLKSGGFVPREFTLPLRWWTAARKFVVGSVIGLTEAEEEVTMRTIHETTNERKEMRRHVFHNRIFFRRNH